jgi:hypothetical protein
MWDKAWPYKWDKGDGEVGKLQLVMGKIANNHNFPTISVSIRIWMIEEKRGIHYLYIRAC